MSRYSKRHAGWDYKIVGSSAATQVELTEKLLSEVLAETFDRENSTHVFSFRPLARESCELARQTFDRFLRFGWLRNTALTLLCAGQPQKFSEEIDMAVALENTWINLVEPSAPYSASMIPECSFSVSDRHRPFWTLLDSANEKDKIKGLESALEKFKHSYFSGYQEWEDEKGIVFSFGGARHGEPEPPFHLKYSERIPSGFHFDVRSRAGSAFTIQTYGDGPYTCANRGYCNIDPHGRLRAS